MAYVNILMNLTDSAATFSSYCPLGNTSAGDKQVSINNLINYLKRLRDGFSVGTLTCQVGAVAGTATLTSTGAATATETFVLCGTTFTARASGATGNEFNVSATPTTQAANMKAAINASADVNTMVSADNVAGVLTITALVPGIIGDGLLLTEGLTNVSISNFLTTSTGSNGTEVTLSLT